MGFWPAIDNGYDGIVRLVFLLERPSSAVLC